MINSVQTFYAKVNDNAVTLQATVLDQNETPVDLTGCTATLTVKNMRSGLKIIDAAAVTLKDQVTDTGGWYYAQTSNQFSKYGKYAAELTVTLSSGKIVTIPRGEGEAKYAYIVIDEKL